MTFRYEGLVNLYKERGPPNINILIIWHEYTKKQDVEFQATIHFQSNMFNLYVSNNFSTLNKRHKD